MRMRMSKYISKAREKYRELRRVRTGVPILDEVEIQSLINAGFKPRVILNRIGPKYLIFFASSTSSKTFLFRVHADQLKNGSFEVPEIRTDLTKRTQRREARTIPTRPKDFDRIQHESFQNDLPYRTGSRQERGKQMRDMSTQTSLSYFIWDTV